jgi:hypothetical protein
VAARKRNRPKSHKRRRRKRYPKTRQGQYRKAIRSAYWKKLKARKIEADPRCNYVFRGTRCKLSDPKSKLQLHHLTYDRLGQEHDDDVLLLCPFHHALIHLATLSCPRCNRPLFHTELHAVHFLKKHWRRYKNPLRLVQLAEKGLCRACSNPKPLDPLRRPNPRLNCDA